MALGVRRPVKVLLGSELPPPEEFIGFIEFMEFMGFVEFVEFIEFIGLKPQSTAQSQKTVMSDLLGSLSSLGQKTVTSDA